jgi:phospholipid/cholesterol/gamma-HCH transport system substrate-binding protein
MPRTRSLAWSQLKIGILTVVAIALAVFLIFLVGGQAGFPWQRYHLKARFADVQGLKSGAVIRLAGVEVGRVTNVEFAGTQVEVTFELTEDVRDKITSNSRAMLGSLSLLGEAVVDLTVGAGGQPLPDWGYVRAQRTPGQIADVAAQATTSIEEATALLRDIRSGRGTVGRLFTDESIYKEFSAFLVSAERVVDSVNRGRGTLGQLVRDPAAYKALRASLDNLEVITTRVQKGEGSLGRLIRDEQLARSLSTTSDNLAGLTDRLNRGEGTAGKLLNDAALYNRLNTISERLDGIVLRLNEGEGTAGRLLHDKQLYENMNGAVTELRTLIADVRKDPRKFLNVRVSIF